MTNMPTTALDNINKLIIIYIKLIKYKLLTTEYNVY